MARDWTSIRVGRDTADELRRIAERTLGRNDRPAGLEATDHHTTPISADATIRYLIAHYRAKQRRSNRPRPSRKRTEGPPDGPAG